MTDKDRIAALEKQVADMKRELDGLRARPFPMNELRTGAPYPGDPLVTCIKTWPGS